MKLTPKNNIMQRDPEEEDYQLLCFKPQRLQCCNNANGFLVMYCIFAIVAGSMIGGISNTNIAALERRFGLDSSESAFIIVSYDIAFCVVTVFVTYFGAQSNIPRLISIGAVVFGLGALVYTLPHFTTPLYDFGESIISDLCNSNATECSRHQVRHDLRYNMYILLLGQVLMGLGATPLYTLGIAYIENSVAKNKAPIYIGLANACTLFGPVIGFTSGGSFLTYFYVDFDGINTESLSFGTDDPRWVGAWWIGPLVMMVLCWVTVIPFWGFPKRLPGTARHRAERESETHRDGDTESVQKLAANTSFENFPKTVLILLKNPTYVFIVVAGCLTGGTVSGATSFLAKFVQNEFHITAGNAAILTGAVLVPAAAAGHLVSGFIISKFKWKTPQIIMYTVVCCILATAFTPSMLVNCDSIPVAGVTVNYRLGEALPQASVMSTCNAGCKCQEEFFVPSCGTDQLTYFSSCHAGCTVEEEIEDTGLKIYRNCSCVKDNLQASSNLTASVQPGYCEHNCSNIKLFLPLVFLLVFFVFQSHTAATVIAFRVVPESLRAFGVGLAWLFFRALGTIPGPIMFGKFIDANCLLWQVRRCSGSIGSCWLYDSNGMAVTVMTLSLLGNLLAGVAFGISWIVYKPPPSGDAVEKNGNQRQLQRTENTQDNPTFVPDEP